MKESSEAGIPQVSISDKQSGNPPEGGGNIRERCRAEKAQGTKQTKLLPGTGDRESQNQACVSLAHNSPMWFSVSIPLYPDERVVAGGRH